MLRHRMIGRQVDQRAGDGIGRQRVVRWRFDQYVGLGEAGTGDGHGRNHRHVAGGDVQLTGADRANADVTVGAAAGNPPVDIIEADRLIDEAGHHTALEHAWKRIVNAPQDRFGKTARLQRKREALLQQFVVNQSQALAQLDEEIDDLEHRRVVQIAQFRRVAQHEIVDVLVRVRLAEVGATAPLELHGIVSGHYDPAARNDGYFEDRLHHASPATNSMNSL